MLNENAENPELQITNLYDNRTSSTELIPGWGFSALVEFGGRRILFDAGADLAILSGNMDQLHVDPAEIDALMISHPHCDHTGGISEVLDASDSLTVYLTESFPDSLKTSVTSRNLDLVTLSKPEELASQVYSTGEMRGEYREEFIPEQSLIVRTSKGPVVIAGCAHPGIENIAERAVEVTGEPPYLVMGGFHLGSKNRDEVLEVISSLKQSSVQNVAPSHCTGEEAESIFEQEFNEDYVRFEVGSQISI